MGRPRSRVQGVGINDADYCVRYQGKVCVYYTCWAGMLRRCYCEKFKNKHPTYKDARVCEQWKTFSVFKLWAEEQERIYKFKIEEGVWQLDKDLLVLGNKIYQPDTCMFVDARTNSLFLKSDSIRGNWPLGVSFNKEKNKFEAYCKNGTKGKIRLGYFKSAKEAHKAWQLYKVNIIEAMLEGTNNERLKYALSLRLRILQSDIMLGHETLVI